MHPPTFDQFAGFLRDWARIPIHTRIRRETRLECDLGITGDDGTDLLRQTELTFGVRLSSQPDGFRSTFALARNESLFHSEGFHPLSFLPLVGRWFSGEVVHPLTVGELFDAVIQAGSANRSRE